MNEKLLILQAIILFLIVPILNYLISKGRVIFSKRKKDILMKYFSSEKLICTTFKNESINHDETQILVVEDYNLTRLALIRILENAGFKAFGVSCGEEAISKIDYYEPNIILMDIGLPGINGLEATKVIKTKRPEIKVIALTSHSEHDIVKGMLEAKAEGYILKDVGVDDLIRYIQDVKNGAIVIDSGVKRVAESQLL